MSDHVEMVALCDGGCGAYVWWRGRAAFASGGGTTYRVDCPCADEAPATGFARTVELGKQQQTGEAA